MPEPTHERPPERPALQPAEHADGAARVVVIDDSVSVCRAIERMLAPRGHRVVSMHSGEEALARLEEERPHLVVCDLVLPDVEGLAICRFVRESTLLRGAALLLISGLATEEARARAHAAGADAVLGKPFRADKLLAEVDRLLALRPPAPAAAAGPVAAAGPARRPQPAAWIVAELKRLPGLAAASWRLADGSRGRLPESGAVAAPDPELILARLRSFAAPLGIGEPTTLLLEGDGGGALVIGHKDGGGTVCLHLTGDATLGKARFLVRQLLRTLAPSEPSTSAYPKEARPWNP